jgi:hypothetical protein
VDDRYRQTNTKIADGAELMSSIPIDAQSDGKKAQQGDYGDGRRAEADTWCLCCESRDGSSANSADLKGTPHPPISQYPFGFFARYCW